MKVVETRHSGDYGSYNSLKITVDGNLGFSVHDYCDSPEDNNLRRNFNDCFLVVRLMEMAYLAGKNGETFEVEFRETED